MRILQLIHGYHLAVRSWPISFAKIVSHLRAGWRFARQHKVPFFSHLRCLNCMTTVYNLYTTLDELSLPYPRQLIDVGANRSQFAEIVSPVLRGGRAVAIEPNPSVMPEVYSELHRCALSDVDGEAYLNVPGGNDEIGSLDARGDGQQYKVSVRRFDSLPISLERPVLVKIDTEGQELKVLKGFGDRLREIDYIVLEVGNRGLRLSQNNVTDIVRYLIDAGFSGMKTLHCCFDGPVSPAYVEYLFWRKGQ